MRTFTISTKSTRTSWKSSSKLRLWRLKQSSKTSSTSASSTIGKRASVTRSSKSRTSTSIGLNPSQTSSSSHLTKSSRAVSWSALSVKTRSKSCASLISRISTTRFSKFSIRSNRLSPMTSLSQFNHSVMKCSKYSNLSSSKTKKLKNKLSESTRPVAKLWTWTASQSRSSASTSNSYRTRCSRNSSAKNWNAKANLQNQLETLNKFQAMLQAITTMLVSIHHQLLFTWVSTQSSVPPTLWIRPRLTPTKYLLQLHSQAQILISIRLSSLWALGSVMRTKIVYTTCVQNLQRFTSLTSKQRASSESSLSSSVARGCLLYQRNSLLYRRKTPIFSS